MKIRNRRYMFVVIGLLGSMLVMFPQPGKKILNKQNLNPFESRYIEYPIEPTDGPANKNKISILAINVEMLRIKLSMVAPGLDKLLIKDLILKEEADIEKRAPKYNDVLKGYDVIVCEEAFDISGRTRLLQALKDNGYKYATKILGSGIPKNTYEAVMPLGYGELKPDDSGNGNEVWASRCKVPVDGINIPMNTFMDGGVLIVSKYPIVDAKQLIFKGCSGWDCGAKKGVAYAKINKDGKFYHIFGTHTDAGQDEIQLPQMASMRRMTNEVVGKDKQEPVIYAGDFNTGSEGEHWKKAEASVPEHRRHTGFGDDRYIGHKSTLEARRLVGGGDAFKNETLEDLAKDPDFKDAGAFVDHIAYSKTNQQPIKAYNQVRPLFSKEPWGVRICDQDGNDCYVRGAFNGGFFDPAVINNSVPYVINGKKVTCHNIYDALPVQDLSDHFAVYGYFEFPEGNDTSKAKKQDEARGK